MLFKELCRQENVIELVEEQLVKLMEENPDFVYSDYEKYGLTQCNYHCGPDNNKDSSEGCVFGQVFQRLGISKEELKGLWGNIQQITAQYFTCPDSWKLIQFNQDRGMSWGNLLTKWKAGEFDV
jgi:hypothetical protein